MSDYYRDLFNDTEKSSEFALIADILTEAVDDVLWNPEDGTWYDFDMDSGKPRNFFTPSNLVPLWTETFSPENKAEMSALGVEYLYRQNFNVFPGKNMAKRNVNCNLITFSHLNLSENFHVLEVGYVNIANFWIKNFSQSSISNGKLAPKL